jgi:sulfur carrier protein
LTNGIGAGLGREIAVPTIGDRTRIRRARARPAGGKRRRGRRIGGLGLGCGAVSNWGCAFSGAAIPVAQTLILRSPSSTSISVSPVSVSEAQRWRQLAAPLYERYRQFTKHLGRMAETADKEMISVKVNGEERSVFAGSTISEMLEELGIDPRKVAVERNLEVVPRSTLGDAEASDGDAFEIVHFVGGG